MSEVSSAAVWNDDGPVQLIDTSVPNEAPTTTTTTNNVSTKTRSPPPIPANKPVSIVEGLNRNVGTCSEAKVTNVHVPVGDLIQFETDEERDATLLNGDNGGYSHVAHEHRSMEDVMKDFLKEEETFTMQDYMRRFYQIRIEQDKFRMCPEFSSDTAIAPLHYTRNRYRDILPYDHNRVAIKNDDENPDGYMNASFIQLPGGKTNFIAAQAPLPSTLDEWWKMIDEHRVGLIVILCKLVEMNKIKCERYWPEEVNKCEIFGDYEITLEEEKTFTDDEYLLRKLKMENQSTGETRTIYQLHYREWPDHGCPSGETQLLNMIDEMVQIHNGQASDSPILVHCSAGVGRTGTIIAVNYVREQMEAGELTEIDVFGLVMALRRQRASMVQTQDQYQFVHRCVATYCRQRLGIEEPKPPELPPHSDLPLTSSSVRLIAPPTPTNPELGTPSYHPDPSSSIQEDDSDATSVPDFPEEPPTPMGPEDLGSAAL